MFRRPSLCCFIPSSPALRRSLFHVLPLALLLTTLDTLFHESPANHLVGLYIFIVAFRQPLFQVNIDYLERSFSWAQVYSALHRFAINLFQHHLFRRYGSILMASFRTINSPDMSDVKVNSWK